MNNIKTITDISAVMMLYYRYQNNISSILSSYPDDDGLYKIGHNLYFYPNGTQVKEGDHITQEQAVCLLKYDLTSFFNKVNELVWKEIKQHQFDALVSLLWSMGIDSLNDSKLIKLINDNPKNKLIHGEFLKYVQKDGNIDRSLIRLRKAESWLFFEGTVNLTL